MERWTRENLQPSNGDFDNLANDVVVKGCLDMEGQEEKVHASSHNHCSGTVAFL